MKDTFDKGFESFSKKYSKYCGFVITDRVAYGRLEEEEIHSCLQNAYICVQRDDLSTIWSIQDGKPKSIPASLSLWFKQPKKLALCIPGDSEDESYIFFDNDDYPFPSNCSIWCVVENEDSALCLFVDSNSNHVTWLSEYKAGTYSSLVEFMQHVVISMKEGNCDE